MMTMYLENELATLDFGKALGQSIDSGATIFLEGTLGAGKTTTVRGVLSAFGYSGAVKSPTYTLVEPYSIDERTIYHFDLYRLGEPEEMEYMGVRDYFSIDSICLIEWPQKALGYLPVADLVLRYTVEKQGRQLVLEAGTDLGENIVQNITTLIRE